jgi:hypothetical protein
MAALRQANLTPLLDLLSAKGGDTSGTVGSIVGHVTAEPSLAPALCKMLAEKVNLRDYIGILTFCYFNSYS